MEQKEGHLDYIKFEEESIIEKQLKQMEAFLIHCLKMLDMNVC